MFLGYFISAFQNVYAVRRAPRGKRGNFISDFQFAVVSASASVEYRLDSACISNNRNSVVVSESVGQIVQSFFASPNLVSPDIDPETSTRNT